MQVTNLYAVSSRFGTPDDFKRLVDEAHGYLSFFMPFAQLLNIEFKSFHLFFASS